MCTYDPKIQTTTKNRCNGCDLHPPCKECKMYHRFDVAINTSKEINGKFTHSIEIPCIKCGVHTYCCTLNRIKCLPDEEFIDQEYPCDCCQYSQHKEINECDSNRVQPQWPSTKTAIQIMMELIGPYLKL